MSPTFDQGLAEVGVAGLQAHAVVDHNHETVSAGTSRLDHLARCGRQHRGILRPAEVEAGMQCRAPVERVAPVAEAAVQLVLGHRRRERHRAQHRLHAANPVQVEHIGVRRHHPLHRPRHHQRAALAFAVGLVQRLSLRRKLVQVQARTGQ